MLPLAVNLCRPHIPFVSEKKSLKKIILEFTLRFLYILYHDYDLKYKIYICVHICRHILTCTVCVAYIYNVYIIYDDVHE